MDPFTLPRTERKPPDHGGWGGKSPKKGSERKGSPRDGRQEKGDFAGISLPSRQARSLIQKGGWRKEMHAEENLLLSGVRRRGGGRSFDLLRGKSIREGRRYC